MRIGVNTSIVILVIIGSLLIIIPTTSADIPETIDYGPYIENIVYKVIPSQDQRILALQAGEIEMDSTYYDPYYLLPSSAMALSADPDIDFSYTLKNGYTCIEFDCTEFPANISGFRRAFAYALNKTKIVADVMNGYGQVLDSVVPYQNQFCIENEFEYHYYDPQPDLGNAILDDLGFAINPETGVRDAPNGSPLYILILSGYTMFADIAEECIAAFSSLNIAAGTSLPCQCDLNQVMNVGIKNFYDQSVSWLAYEYLSVYDTTYFNTHFIKGFSNTTYDSWRTQLLYSQSYEDTFEAASEMQKILHYNVPVIPLYQDIRLHPYRNDWFKGHIDDSVNSIYGPWTMLNIRRLDSAFGGTVTVGIRSDPNFSFVAGTSGHWLLTNLHSALYTRDPDQLPYPQLASSLEIETHADNPSVIEGHSRFTFEIRDDIKWTDGVPLTTDDVFFTLNSSLYGLSDLSSVYSPKPGTVVVEFSTESYWHFDRIAYNFIVPKRIFENIPREDWFFTNLITTDDGKSLNCGPFMLTDFEDGEFYELTSRYRYSIINDGFGTLIAIVRPVDDFQVAFSTFTLRWNLDWKFYAFNENTEDGRFDFEFTPAYSRYYYMVIVDGNNYTEGISDGYYLNSQFLDVNIEISSQILSQHNVTLVLYNGFEAPQIDTVMVTVILPVTFMGFLAATFGSIIGIASVAIIWHLRLRRSQLQHLDS